MVAVVVAPFVQGNCTALRFYHLVCVCVCVCVHVYIYARVCACVYLFMCVCVLQRLHKMWIAF